MRAVFVLMIVVGFVGWFWYVFAVLGALIVLACVAFWLARRADERRSERAALVRRADCEHLLFLAGDFDRGVYGIYPPARPPSYEECEQ